MSVIIQLAEALVAKLNEGGFSQAFTARRHYRPIFELKDLDTLRVTVVPKAIESELESRHVTSNDVSIDVGVMKHVDPNQPAEIDALMTLVEEIVIALTGYEVASPSASWLAVANDPIYAPDHLAEKHVFTSVVTVKYRIWR